MSYNNQPNILKKNSSFIIIKEKKYYFCAYLLTKRFYYILLNLMKINIISKIVALIIVVSFFGCNKNATNDSMSRVTGWKYNDKEGTGFIVKSGYKLETPPGMVAVEGGSYTIGEKGEFVTAPRDNKRRRITVSSFFMDQYEIRNIDWREYTNWLKVIFKKTAPKLIDKAQPNEKVWREELAYNEPYLQNYFSHPAYDQYPIVGVTWEQAMDYCAWRTDRVNELALVNAGVIEHPNFAALKNLGKDSISNTFVFNTQKYLLQNKFQPNKGSKPLKDLYGQERKADISDGILFSEFRLPTEAEWEFAAFAINSNNEGIVPDGKLYPWKGSHLRNTKKKHLGMMQANYVRGRGDMMGTSGSLNDKATITAPIDDYYPNDFGLYNMAGNVNEWVLDVYRSTSFDEVAEYNSFRGNMYLTPIEEGVDSAGNKTYKLDDYGRIATEVKKGDDLRNYRDGDTESQIFFSLSNPNLIRRDTLDITDILRPVISDRTRVYKGGSWKDRAFWLNPSTRRYLEQDKCTSDIGFRCAMSMIGSKDKVK